MTTLLLIRHGIAENPKPGSPDSERPLSAEGWETTRRAMKGLVGRGHVPTCAVASPYRRALETLACLQEASPGGFPEGTWEGLLPGASVRQAELWLQAQLAELPDEAVLALVGHQPFMSDFVMQLCGKSLDFQKASCAVLAWERGRFTLVAYYAPADLLGRRS